MRIADILTQIDMGSMVLPEFQRGYVWGREQVRGLFDSLYKGHPVGGLLVWVTESGKTAHRGSQDQAAGVVNLLLDGQQRMTSLYGVVRGKPPAFFDGNAQAFTGLHFNLEDEIFEFYQPQKMQNDPVWVDVSALLKAGIAGMGAFLQPVNQSPVLAPNLMMYMTRLNKLLAILDRSMHIEQIMGPDKTLDVVVDIFNRVNSGGTKLSKGDLALAKVCADWPQARVEMKHRLAKWKSASYEFDLDWLLRTLNTTLNGEARFIHLHTCTRDEIEKGLSQAEKHIDTSLNAIAARLGLDHDQVLFNRYAIPVMAHYLEQFGKSMDGKTRDKLLFWFVASGMWGRFSTSTESTINQDIEVLNQANGNLDGLLAQLRLWHGGLKVQPGHFTAASLGARFYPVLYMLTRMSEARDLGNGTPLKAQLLGAGSRLEVHHIFPKAQLYKLGHSRSEANALGNFCFLTKLSNLQISDKRPEIYFEEVEKAHPGVLASQWIPMDRSLWKLDRYLDFLEARKELLAEATNKQLVQLLHGDIQWLEPLQSAASAVQLPASQAMSTPAVRNDGEQEEAALSALQCWVAEQGLAKGVLAHELADPDSGEQLAVLDLAWPAGLQEGLSEPVALLIDEPTQVLAYASRMGFKCFTEVAQLRQHIEQDVLAAIPA